MFVIYYHIEISNIGITLPIQYNTTSCFFFVKSPFDIFFISRDNLFCFGTLKHKMLHFEVTSFSMLSKVLSYFVMDLWVKCIFYYLDIMNTTLILKYSVQMYQIQIVVRVTLQICTSTYFYLHT